MANQIEEGRTEEQVTEQQRAAALAENSSEEATQQEQGQEHGDEEAVVDVKSIKRGEDGKLMWQPDPEKTPNIVYKGDSIDELLSNIGKNIVDKETYIKELQSKTTKSSGLKVEVASRKTVTTGESHSDASAEIVWPDHEEILKKMASKAGVDLRVFSMTPEQWREHELEHGAVNTLRLQTKMERVLEDAQTTYNEQNIAAVNDHQLIEETDQVAELLRESGLSESELDFNAVLEKVHENPANFLKSGARRSGVITAAASKEIQRLVREKAKAEGSKESDERVARARIEKEEGKGGDSGPSRRTFSRPAVTAPKSTADALTQALASYAAQRKK